MITRDNITEALSKIDQKYIDEAVDHVQKSQPRRKTGSRRFAAIGTVAAVFLLIAGIAAGIIIAVKVRKNSSLHHGTEPTVAPTDRLPEGDYTVYHIPDLVELIYSDAVESYKTISPETTGVPGGKNDVDMLPKASSALEGKEIAVLFDESYAGEIFMPVYSLHRDPDVNGGFKNSGSIVLMLNYVSDYASGVISITSRSVMIEGYSDDIENAVFYYNPDKGKVCAGPFTVKNVFIIDTFDGKYPEQAIYSAYDRLAFSQRSYPMYVYVHALPTYGREPDTPGKVRANSDWSDIVGEIECSSLSSGRDAWTIYEYNASVVNIDPFIDTYRRFGLDYLERIKTYTVGSAIIDPVKTSSARYEAYLYGYPDFNSLHEYIRSSGKCEYIGIKKTDRGVIFQYLLKYDSEAIMITTPELYQSGYWNSAGWPELVYDISIDGVWYTVASDNVQDTVYPKLDDTARLLIADNEPFKVISFSIYEYESLVVDMKIDTRLSKVMAFNVFLEDKGEIYSRATLAPSADATEAPN